jgi:hypothetical protein
MGTILPNQVGSIHCAESQLGVLSTAKLTLVLAIVVGDPCRRNWKCDLFTN